MEDFKVGDKVTWWSCSTVKDGVVVRVLSEADIPGRVAVDEFPNHRKMFDGYRIPGGYPKGYLVEVKIGKTDKAKKGLYLPYPSKLEMSGK